MTPRTLNDRLLERIENVCRELLPNGKRMGQEWVCGDLSGQPGQSCRIHLSGEKAGVWSDFQTGEKGGDLLDLWGAVRHLTLAEVMREAKAWLGIAEIEFEPTRHKTYRRPVRADGIHRPSKVADYLRQRRLTEATIAKFQLGEDARGNIVFPYKREGQLLGVKYMALERPDGKKKIWVEPDCEPCLFGWQALDPNVRTVALCEGEIDCMTLHQVGIPALSLPFGGGTGDKQRWIEYEYLHLERFDQIFLCLDQDAAGQAATMELLDRLGRYRCRVVELPYKDANEALLAGATSQDFARWFMAARVPDPDELKNAGAFVEDVIAEFYPSSENPPGMRLPWEKVGYRVLFRPGEVSIWTGWNGSGKSLLLGYLMVHGMSNRDRVCIASLEMQPRKTLMRMIRQITGLSQPSIPYIRAVHEWLADKLWLFDLVGTAKTSTLLSIMEYARRRYAISHFIIDSLAKCGMSEDDYNAQKAFVETLSDFAREHNAHVHLIAHARKGSDEHNPPGKMDVKGS
ncbi:MAG TPA: toprim domain-containing protein, partial [Candidatus Competibacteraceae bacterium]|nr:toprim domain-containing protein [Candidatus Competibacteraceae bacterium]